MTALAQRVAAPAFGLPGRIQSPNSRPRSMALVGLGEGGAAMAQSLRQGALAGVNVKVFASPRPLGEEGLATIKSNGDDLHRAILDADMIFVVARKGDNIGLVPVVSRIARGRNAQVTAIYIVAPGDAHDGEEDENLRVLRSGVQMLVVATDESYVAAMVVALGG